MKNFMFNSWVKAQLVKQSVKDRFTSEEGGADTIIIAVIIILVVVVIGFLFKDWIIEWFNGLTGDVTSELEAGNNFSATNAPTTSST